MAAYIQFKDGMPYNEDMASAWYGFTNENVKVLSCTYEDLDNAKIEVLKKNVFVGTTAFMKKVWKKLGVNPKIISFPDVRHDFQFGTLGEVLDKFKSTKSPVFVKPLEIKLFDGYPITDEWNLSYLKDYPLDTKVGYCPVYKFDAEFRIYVNDGRIIDIKNYVGKLSLFPNQNEFQYINDIIKKNLGDLKFPSTYALDYAKGDDLWMIIEYNDFWALGNYGMPAEMYAKLLKKRYFEIVNTPSVTPSE